MNNRVTVLFEKDDKNKKVIISYSLFIIGVKCEILENFSDENLKKAMIYYGTSRPESFNGIFIPEKEINTSNLKENINYVNYPDESINVDVISLIGILLIDEVNEYDSSDNFDQLNRLKYKSSFQFKNDFSDVPLINILISYLEKLIDQHYFLEKIPLWPNHKKSTIVLSHDVDAPSKHAELFNYRFFPKKATQVIRHYYHYLRLFKNYLIDRNKNDYWLFEDIIDFEKSLGFKSTFFFATINKNDKYAHPNDVDYKIHDESFVNVFNKIKESDFEIGLHASFNAYIKADRFTKEKETLEKLAKVEVKGLRHHYWHMAKNYKDTLIMHDKAGFEYDTSIAFNFNIGFRNNIALPFPILIDNNKRYLNMIEIPTFCMDGNVFYNHDNVEQGFQDVIKFISILKKNKGIGCIDWHVRTSFPRNKHYHRWGKLYVKILEELAEDNEIWVTNYKEVIDWIKERKRKLTMPNNVYMQWLRD